MPQRKRRTTTCRSELSNFQHNIMQAWVNPLGLAYARSGEKSRGGCRAFCGGLMPCQLRKMGLSRHCKRSCQPPQSRTKASSGWHGLLQMKFCANSRTVGHEIAQTLIEVTWTCQPPNAKRTITILPVSSEGLSEIWWKHLILDRNAVRLKSLLLTDEKTLPP